MIDVDDFELVNDVYGHGDGDRFLREMSWVMRESLGNDQLLFRLGGDEFAVVLPGVTSRARCARPSASPRT